MPSWAWLLYGLLLASRRDQAKKIGERKAIPLHVLGRLEPDRSVHDDAVHSHSSSSRDRLIDSHLIRSECVKAAFIDSRRKF